MTSAALIALRETLETSLIVGIMLGVLRNLSRRDEEKFVWMGVAGGIVWSIVLATIFSLLSTHLPTGMNEIYEGVMMLAAAGLLTWAIVWMRRMGSQTRTVIERDIEGHAKRGEVLGIFLLSFTTTAREGTEMALFLHAAFIGAGSHLHSLIGAIAGMVGALAIAVFLFRGSGFISLKNLFQSTTILLVLVAGGLVSHAIHEFQEIGLLTILGNEAWNISTFIAQESPLANILSVVIGDIIAPTLLQILGHITYLVIAIACLIGMRPKQHRVQN
jgi:high-affinity iron transporter